MTKKQKSENNDLSILILSGGRIKEKFHFIRPMFLSPALMPINSRAIISHILDFYVTDRGHNRIYLAISEEDEETVRRDLHRFGAELQYILIGPSRGVNETLTFCLEEIPDEGEIIVNLVTTIPTVLPELDEVLIADSIESDSEYSLIDIGKKGVHFIGKGKAKGIPGHPFTGIFRVPIRDLKEAMNHISRFDDLLDVVIALNQNHPRQFRTAKWIDVGHEVNYNNARLQLLRTRAFNNLQVDIESGILVKSSLHAEKFENEIRYYETLPRSLQIFFPRLIESHAEMNGVLSASMEFYGYPNLSEYQLYWDIPFSVWSRIIDKIEKILQKFQEYPFSIGPEAFSNFYLAKTLQRTKEMHRTFNKHHESDILKNNIMINGQACRSFNLLFPEIEKRVKSMYREEDFYIMHGDFCFNNILYDLVSGLVKLLDPRGSFGENCQGIYGDFKYDLAKLAHSAIGGYDYIVNDLFQLESEKQGIYTYSFTLRDNDSILRIKLKQLVEKFGYDCSDIDILMGLLFVSMCPLHSESYDRQKVMYLHGLNLLNREI
jgi:hypothetical protein